MRPEASDGELVCMIAARADAAAGAEVELFRRFAGRIRLYGLRHLKAPAAADDLVQDVLMKVIEAIRESRLERPDQLASFVLGTCRNVTWDARRAEGKQRAIEREAAPLAEVSSPPELSETDVVRLFGCMAALPQREAMVVRMSYLEDRAAEEIGARLGLSSGNVRVIRHRALGRLSECLQSKEVE